MYISVNWELIYNILLQKDCRNNFLQKQVIIYPINVEFWDSFSVYLEFLPNIFERWHFIYSFNKDIQVQKGCIEGIRIEIIEIRDSKIRISIIIHCFLTFVQMFETSTNKLCFYIQVFEHNDHLSIENLFYEMIHLRKWIRWTKDVHTNFRP